MSEDRVLAGCWLTEQLEHVVIPMKVVDDQLTCRYLQCRKVSHAELFTVERPRASQVVDQQGVMVEGGHMRVLDRLAAHCKVAL